MSDWQEAAADLLSEGLDLCVRARSMEAMDRRKATLDASCDPGGWQADGRFDDYVTRHNAQYLDQPIRPRSATVHLWMEDQYDKDLADWERRARAHLLQRPSPL